MNDEKKMTHREFFEALKEGKTFPDIAEELGLKSRTTLTKALKRAGYQYDRPNQWYNYEGEGPEPIDEPLKLGRQNSKRKDKTSENDVQLKDEKSIDEEEVKEKASKIKEERRKKEVDSKNQENNHDDDIDVLLKALKYKKKERSYTGFYLESDVKKVIENLPHGSKSEIVNAILRKGFREKGLL